MSFSLVLGGVRSGKSRLAVDLAARQGAPVTFIATAAAFDDGMTQRIEAHRAERSGRGWTTIESPYAAPADLASVPDDDFVVLDCVTIWTTNRLLAEIDHAVIVDEAERLAAWLAARSGGAVVVSNEVGMGVHPSTELGRDFRDLLGAVNGRFAALAERSVLLVAGKLLQLEDPDAVFG